MTKTTAERSRVFRELGAMKKIAYEIDGLHYLSPYDKPGAGPRIDYQGRERAVAWLIAYFDLPFDRRPDPPPPTFEPVNTSEDEAAYAARQGHPEEWGAITSKPFPEIPPFEYKTIEVTDEAD